MNNPTEEFLTKKDPMPYIFGWHNEPLFGVEGKPVDLLTSERETSSWGPENHFANKYLKDQSKFLWSVLSEIADLRKIGKNWDGENSEPISEQTWENVKSFVLEFYSHPFILTKQIDFEVGPCSNGTVDLECYDYGYLLINIPGNEQKKPTFFIKKQNGIESKGFFDINDLSLMEFLFV